MKSGGIKTAGQGTSTWGNGQVIGSGKSGNAVEQDHNIFSVFHQTFCTFDYHFGNTFMMFRKFIEGRVNDFDIFAFDTFLDIGYFFRTFIN